MANLLTAIRLLLVIPVAMAIADASLIGELVLTSTHRHRHSYRLLRRQR